MIIIISYILNLFAPIVNALGAIGFCTCFVYDDIHMLWYGGILAVVGLVFGILAYSNDIPPRWFWSKSKNALFEFSITAVLGYMVNFAAWPFAIYLITTIAAQI